MQASEQANAQASAQSSAQAKHVQEYYPSPCS